MKTRMIVFLFGAVTLLAVLSAVAFTRQNPAWKEPANARHFDVTGQVLAIDSSAKTVRIAHQEIPNYMPAMTMPFVVREPSLLKGLAPGEQVGFRLVVTDDDSWIDRITPLLKQAHPSGARPARAEKIGAAPDADPLELGETVPDLSLLDQNGRPVHLSEYRGKAVVLTFIYTRCPIPNFCPLMSRNFAALGDRLEKSCPGRFHLLSISFDPAFDTPEVLKSYAARFEANEQNWTFSTGSPEQIETAASLFGLTREPENGLIAHDLRTALISPAGKLVHVWKSNVWTPLEVERLVQEMLNSR